MRAPRYGTRSLAEVLPSVASALGVSDVSNELALPEASQAVVVVVDGLGHEQLLAAASHAPLLHEFAAAQEPVDAAFPTTTPAGLATLTLGLTPGVHGFVGATFELPDYGCVLNPLHWDDQPAPVAVLPEPNLFSQFQGLHIRSHGPQAFASTGMTQRLLHAAEPCGYEQFDPSRIDVAAGRLDYVYLPQLDKVGHSEGPNSGPWRQCLWSIDRLVREIRSRLPQDAFVLVTSDHGMVDVPADHRVDIDGAHFMTGVRLLAGEPRMRHIYTDVPEDVAERWSTALEARATVLLRNQAIALGLFGEVDEMLEDRIGDVVAIAHDQWALTSRVVDPRVSGLRGLHGALTDAELLVPAVVLHGVA